MKKTKIAVLSLCLGLLIAVSLPVARAASRENQAKEILKELQLSAATVAGQTDELSLSIRDGNWSPETQAYRLETVKEEVNQMGREMSKLEQERGTLRLWEQQAIDRSLPLLQEIAANTESAITYFNANKSHLWAETYRGYVEDVRQDSEQISKTVKGYLKYAKLEDQKQRLQENLEMRAN
jgi:hypothetical protein